MRDNRLGAEITVKSMLNALSTGIVYCTCGHFMKDDTQEVHLIPAGFVLHPELLHKEGPATRSQVREETWMQRIPHGKSTSKKMQQKEI